MWQGSTDWLPDSSVEIRESGELGRRRSRWVPPYRRPPRLTARSEAYVERRNTFWSPEVDPDDTADLVQTTGRKTLRTNTARKGFPERGQRLGNHLAERVA